MTNFLNSTEKFVQIELEPTEFNWISFYQFYFFILPKKSLILFPYLYSQARINELNSSKKYSLNNLLQPLDINYLEFKDLISELEKQKLISIFSEEENSRELLILKLNSPESLKQLVKVESLSNQLPKFKQAELNYGFEKHQDSIELTFFKNSNESENSLENFNSDQIALYWSLYDGIYKIVEKEFTLSPTIIKLIENYQQNQQLTFSRLIELASLSLRISESNDYYLSIFELTNLINEELGINQKLFKGEDYHSFWQNLHNRKDKKDLKKEFKSLFSDYSEITFYLKLTKKKQAPAKLEQWIQDCIKKHLEKSIINGMMSFVYSLLKKIPINYLIKMSDNLINDGINTIDQFLTHLKNFAKHELKNKNRFKVFSEELTR
ncbi:replication initiation and membrane attachment protein, DnaB2 [Mycoplasma ovis str. Michigan]|uniref:Replication initiation and membrane attachment protein, DnaB2 n=1 Tax=Mycoplasma ovis str. Michigan TaxID=1415773 RepID=A0ABM5P0V5_9MOLU|nr:replication initiation and membrane attachment protein, DnaB2 [Mycoplasma ovis str. Michigan]